MPRLCRSRPAALLGCCTAIIVALQGAAQAQSSLLRPPDGEPGELPRFQQPADGRRLTGVPTFGHPPAFGAGTSGFNSSNARPKAAKSARPPAPPPPPPLPAQAPAAQARAQAAVTAQNPPPDTGAFTATPPVPPRRKPAPELDPFEPVGIRAGAFLLKPALEVTGGHDSNPARSLNGTGSSFYVVAPELTLQSLWSRHELRAELRGSYTSYQQASSLNRPLFDGKVIGRVDVSRDTRVDLEGRLLVSTDNPGSPNLQADLARLPVFTTVGGTAGVAHAFNRFEISAKGMVDRTSYEASELTDGTTVSNDDRNYTQYGGLLRGSYELGPGVKPFVELGADRRVHDAALNCFCEMRDSNGSTIRAGSTFELTRLLTGELSAGYLTRSYEDPNLPELSGWLMDGVLVWTPTGLTTVRLTAKSNVEETTLFGVSGIFRRDFGVQVDHAFRRWLIATARFGYGFDTYPGSVREDDRYLASAALTYKASRELHLKGEVRQEWLNSNQSANDYTATVLLLGVRLQR